MPVHIDFHGGSFITGSCLEQAPFCAMVARETSRIVMSVDYRMGPFAQFPAAIEDAEDVLSSVLDKTNATEAGKVLRKAIQQHCSSHHKKTARITSTPTSITLDPSRISLSGFSSGGNLALNLALSITTPSGLPWPSLLPSSPPIPIPVLLFYPSLDARLLPHQRPRPACMGPAPLKLSLLASLEAILMPTYLAPHLRPHLRASPGLASPRECLHRRARILLVLPELDSLAEQSEAWVGKMRDEGREGQLEVVRVEGVGHGWTQFPERWLGVMEREEKGRVFQRAVGFVRAVGE